jgi:hypothetical protein
MLQKLAAKDAWGNVIFVGLALLPAALVSWTGWWVLGVSAVVLLTLLLRRGVRRPLQVAATATALLGGVVGVSSAALAIATIGAAPPYESRVALGWSALALAFAATAVGVATPARQGGSSIAMTLAGCMGAVAMSFFYINTYYFAALPLWLVAAASRLAGLGDGPRHEHRCNG